MSWIDDIERSVAAEQWSCQLHGTNYGQLVDLTRLCNFFHVDRTLMNSAARIVCDSESVPACTVSPCGKPVYSPCYRLHATMTEPTRLDQIEIKLAHLERALNELNDSVLRQQREIELLAARNRQLKYQLEVLEAGGGASADGLEKPPHY
jgi:SlyX protein